MKRKVNTFDFTDCAVEITGDALYLINGGAEVENSIAAQANAQVGDTVTNSRGETYTLTQGDIDWAKKQIGSEKQSTKIEQTSPTSNSQSAKHIDPRTIDLSKHFTLDPDSYTSIDRYKSGKLFSDIVKEKIDEHLGDQYVVGGFMCDNFVETILMEAAVDPLNYLSGKAAAKTVQNHIDHALENNATEKIAKENAPELENGVYVVFMNDSSKKNNSGTPWMPHAGLIIKDDDEGLDYADNSSGNDSGGVEINHYTSLQQFQTAYAYNSFYYQKVEKEVSLWN